MIKYALAGAVAALTLAAAPAQATTYNIGSSNFFITNGAGPFDPLIKAIFFNSYDSGTSFDDTFTFIIPQNGVGSGSISTSFSSTLNNIVIDQLIINGVSYTLDSDASGQSAVVGGIPIVSGIQNYIRVVGTINGAGGDYAGTATFNATAVPEPASWALLISGFAILGGALRRRPTRVSFA